MSHGRIFLFEWLSCGGMAGQDLYPSLAREGKAMFLSLLKDLSSIPGLTVVTSLDLRSVQPGDLPPHVEWFAAKPDSEGVQFREIAGSCSRALVVAPELGGALVRTSRWLGEVGCESLGPGPDILEKVTDKSVFAETMAGHGVPVIPTICWLGGASLPYSKCVAKLATGAGSFGTRMIYTTAEANQVLSWAEKNHLGKVLLQPYWDGQPVSVSALVGPHGALLLEPSTQEIGCDGTFSYFGGSAPLVPEWKARACQLARKALAVWEGLKGWIGLDMILDRGDGRGDVVVELNPRCTTSYTGLRHLTRMNLVRAWLEITKGISVPIDWNAGRVSWSAQGNIEVQQ